MQSEQLTEITKEEWRELGFYYDYDKDSARWTLIGSRVGLLKFSDLLIEYSRDKRREHLSEHEHYGPYWYLKVTTWSVALICSDGIRGTLQDIANLSNIVKQRLSNARVGDTIVIDQEYGKNNEAIIEMKVQDNNFDPVSADSCL